MITRLLYDDLAATEMPDRVLGRISKGTGQWGRDEVIKTMSDEAMAEIIIGDAKRPTEQPFYTHSSGYPMMSDKQVEDNARKAIVKTMAAQKMPSKAGTDLMQFDEVLKTWGNAGDKENGINPLSEDEIKAWVFYQRGRLFSNHVISDPRNGYSKYLIEESEIESSVKRWIEKDIVVFDGLDIVPMAVFLSGNIYEKQVAFNKNRDAIVLHAGVEAFEKWKLALHNAIPTSLKLDAPLSERLFISPVDPFISEFTISQTVDGLDIDEDTPLLGAFAKWLYTLSAAKFKNGSTAGRIVRVYINETDNLRGAEASEKADIRRKAQLDGIELFSEFLAEQLFREDRQRLEYLWNATYNCIKEPDYKKIPIAMPINRYFNNAPIDPRQALWEGVKWSTITGSGIIAYDVGVGKTMTAILAAAHAMYTGQCKRPLIVVPNPTYHKWIKECVGQFDKDGKVTFHGVLPHFKDRVNDWFNLGVDHEHKVYDGVQDYSITFVTFEGFRKMGYSTNTRRSIGDRIFSIVAQNDEADRYREKLREDIDKALGNVQGKSVVNVDELGFDYLVFDEAHNARNLFSDVRGHHGEKSRYDAGSQSKNASQTAICMLAFSLYMIDKVGEKNMLLLTATPFTNKPLEIFAMLTYVSHMRMSKRGFKKAVDFYDKFVLQESEWGVNHAGEVELLTVVKKFQNKMLMQSMIFDAIIHKTGEEAKVLRPIKVVYPRTKDEKGITLPQDEQVSTFLQLTPTQKEWMDEISAFAAERPSAIDSMVPGAYIKKGGVIPARALIAINLAKQCTVHPSLMKMGGGSTSDPRNPDKKIPVPEIYLIDDPIKDRHQFVEESPKIQYVMECIRTVKEWHENRNETVSGQVIYMNMAVNYFPYIAEYLVEDIGFNKSEVAIISSGVTNEKREQIKEGFNNGKIKVLIGSASIREGIDLQMRSTVLYNCALDWNPTDIQQLEGRIHRQNNQHSHVRIVTPLCENSIDVYLFQKLEEKTARINDLWKREGRSNVLDTDNFDPRELKIGLMTRPDDRVKTIIEIEAEKLKIELGIAASTELSVLEATRTIKDYYDSVNELEEIYPKYLVNAQSILNERKVVLENPELTEKQREDATKRVNAAQEILNRDQEDPKNKIALVKFAARAMSAKNYAGSYENSRLYATIANCDRMLRMIAEIASLQKNVLGPRDLNINDDFTEMLEEMRARGGEIKKRLDYTLSEENRQKVRSEVIAEMEAAKVSSRPTSERVVEFTRHNYLLSCLQKVHNCDLDGNVATRIDAPKPAPAPIVQDDITEAIEGLRVLLSISEKPEQKSLREAINGLEVLQTLQAA